MEFVVNEWLLEYLRPDAPDSEKALVLQFLQRFMQRQEDKIFVREPSAFLNKIFLYAKTYQRDTETVTFFRTIIKEILLDFNKCYRVTEYTNLPTHITEKLNQPNTNFNSDTYLFEAASHTKDKIIVTTDEKLARQMQDIDTYKVVLLSEFLKDY